MRLETVEPRRGKKSKKVEIESVSFEFAPKKGGRMAKPTLIFKSPEADIPPMNLTPELAKSIIEMMGDYLEGLKASQWDGDYRIHGDWEDPQPEDHIFFDNDDW